MANIVLDFLHNYQTGERRESEPANAYQYDEGHVLEAVLPEVITSCEIHYWIRGMEEADAYTPTSITPNEDDSCTVLGNIPNKYFETNGELRIYIVVTDGTASITTYEGKLHICQRSMPDDYVDDDPDNEATRILAEVREAAATATDAATRAEEAAESVPEDYSQLSEDVTQLKEDIAHITSSAVPTTVRQAIKTLFETGGYADTGLTDEMAVISSWASQVTAIALNQSSISISGSSTFQLVATTTPAGGAVTWSSSDTSVATVLSNGLVTGVGNGTAKITATSGDVSATCTATVSGFKSLVSISAVYTQSGTVYDTDPLDDLKTDLVVTGLYDDQSTETITNYTLSGTLEVGTSTIVVSYGGKTTTFTVTISADNRFPLTYQGDFTTATPSSTRVTLGLEDMTLEYGQTLTVSVDSGYVLFPLEEYGAGNDESLIRTAKAKNQIYVYGANASSGFVYVANDMVCGFHNEAKIKTITNWNVTKDYAIQNSAISAITFSGVAFLIEKGDTNAHGSEDITIDEAKNTISWSIS